MNNQFDQPKADHLKKLPSESRVKMQVVVSGKSCKQQQITYISIYSEVQEIIG